MDKGLQHERMCQMLKTEREAHPSPRQAVLTNQWDCVESDTESLAQEKASQQNKHILPAKAKADSLHYVDGEDEDANEEETEDLRVYDSLEVVAYSHAKRIPRLLQTDVVTKINERAGMCQLPSDDAYAHLRYDPNWRNNLNGAARFNESPKISIEDFYPEEKHRQACDDRMVEKGGYRYFVDISPAVVTPHMADDESDQPFCLHPQDGQNSSGTSAHSHNSAFQLRSPETDLLTPSSILCKNHDCDNSADNISGSPELTEDVHATYTPEFNTYYHDVVKHKGRGPAQTQQIHASALSNPKAKVNKKPERIKDDIVERNKITLGRNTSKCGSYMTMHTLKNGTLYNVHETFEDAASKERQEDSSDAELKWLQKTQQLRVTQISKGKNAQRKVYCNPSLRTKEPPVLGVRVEPGDCLSSPIARPAAVTQPKHQKTTSQQPLPPTFHLNINRYTSPSPLPLHQPGGQEAVIGIASPNGCAHSGTASEAELVSPSRYQQASPEKSSYISPKGANAQHHRQDSSPEQWQRASAMKWSLSCEGEDQKGSPNEVHSQQFPQNLPRTPTTIPSPGSNSYTVLPPIGKPLRGEESELSPCQSINAADPIHTHNSDGYLVQMERQKQLRARVTYKAYSLKDYKQLKFNVKLQGLGPDYKAIEMTKMKRQRLYSNVIREQNKKISRIPFQPAKDPEGSDKKVPRMKALEYAKTISKPSVQSQSKQRKRDQSKGFTEGTPVLEDLDMSQPATLKVLRKRHEEEKKAVAVFRNVHAL